MHDLPAFYAKMQAYSIALSQLQGLGVSFEHSAQWVALFKATIVHVRHAWALSGLGRSGDPFRELLVDVCASPGQDSTKIRLTK